MSATATSTNHININTTTTNNAAEIITNSLSSSQNNLESSSDLSNSTSDSNSTTSKNVSHSTTATTTTTNTNTTTCTTANNTTTTATTTTTNVHSKSATLTPGQHTNGHGSLAYHARNNLRRSFTLPRGLFKQTTTSENKNESFVRNIFLTLTRKRNPRRPKKNQDSSPVNGFDSLPNPGFTPAALGLKNQGNTCFMNAIVQCLSHTDALAKYLVTDIYKNDLKRKNWIKSGKGEVTEELAAILRSTWLRQNATVVEDAVSRFKAAVERGAQQWRGAEQHDAQEFLLWLLDRLHEDLNQAASTKYKPVKNNFGRPDEHVAEEAYNNHLRCNRSIIQDIFGAQFRSSLTCPGCGRQSATFDPFLCVSLPIPQAKQECPIFVNIVYLSQQPRQVKLGLSLSANADVKELKQLLAADTGIEENNILLLEIDGEGFHRTFTETQLVSTLQNNEALYCMETPQVRESNENDGAYLLITWSNILVTSDVSTEGSTRVRFGSTYISQIARETNFVDLQKLLLKEMATILHPGVLISEQKEPVFNIRVLDGSQHGSLVDPLVEHPLYMESVDDALSLCDEDVPLHIKIHLEWTSQDKDRIIADDSECVEEHSSVAQTRLRHNEETVSTVTLGECFDLYTTAEQLSAEDSWHCPHCNRKEQGTLKMIGLWTAPQVLVVHLKRFRQALKWRVSATKISSVVDFPIEGLDLGPHVTKKSKVGADGNNIANGGSLNQASSPINGCFSLGSWKRHSFKKHLVATNAHNRVNSATHGNNPNNQNGEEKESLIYDLFAVCNHHGKDMQGGHYTAYCKNPVEGSWWSFDDTKVSQLSSPEEVKNPSAYILFYHKRNTGSSPPPPNNFHWYRNLLKKCHKVSSLPPSSSLISNSTSVNGNIHESTNNQNSSSNINGVIKEEPKDVVNHQSCVDNVNKSVNCSSSPLNKQSQPQVNGYHNHNGVSSSNNYLSSSSSLSSKGNSAPLARMELGMEEEERGIGIGLNGLGLPKEVQIESTV